MSNITDSDMGLPRVSGKRRWSETGNDQESLSNKILCTSPPHAICAEDSLQSNTPTSPPSNAKSLFAKSDSSRLVNDMDQSEDNTVEQTDFEQLSECSEEEEPFIDDEEDKDSGFIDGNSIDNSSDDEMDSKGDTSSSVTSSPETSTKTHCPAFTSFVDKEPSCKIELDLSPEAMDTVTNHSTNLSLPIVTLTNSLQTSSFTISQFDTSDNATPFTASTNASQDNEITTVTSALSGAAISSSNHGTMSAQTYELHNLSGSYSTENYLNRPGTPSWSCNFYDGSIPNTNKYMEISPPTRSPSNQSIQCDENGKSYLQLGSASPYTNTYSNECANFTTSPSTYQNCTYTSSFSGNSTYGQQGTPYYNNNNTANRQTYNNPNTFGYNQSETGYCSYEPDTASSYGYSANTFPQGRGNVLGRGAQRCISPFCDPTKTRPRPGCYQQQRLSVFNMSMYKLNRFSRFPEPSLHKSVLICNTLRHIEKELEVEGVSMASVLNHSQNYGPPNPPITPAPSPIPENSGTPDNMPSIPSTNQLNEGPLPSIHPPMVGSPMPIGVPFSPSIHDSPTSPPPPVPYNSPSLLPCQSTLYSGGTDAHIDSKEPLPSLRPYHMPNEDSVPTTSSSSTDLVQSNEEISWSNRNSISEEKTEGINWCSVLMSSSQSDMDSVNNNECNSWSEDSTSLSQIPPPTQTTPVTSTKLPSLSVDDVLKSFPEGNRRQDHSEEIDSLIEDILGS